MSHFALNIEIVITVLIIISIVSLIARKFNLPSTLVLILTGLFLSFFDMDLGIHLTPELLLTLFLPALLFEGAMNIDFSEFRRNLKSISVFSIIGVLTSVFSAGFLVHYILKIPWQISFLLATMIVPTDPIAVLNIFKKLGVSKKLTTIIEGESLFNDGTSLVLFKLFLAGVVTGSFSIKSSLVGFARLFFGGIALGFLLGYLLSKILKRVDDSMIQLSLTTVLAYSSFLIAEKLGLSGVVCSVTSGLVIGNYATRFISPSSKISIASFWEFIGSILNSIVFLLIGIEISIDNLITHINPIVLAFVSIIAARAVSIYVLSFLINKIDDSKLITGIDEFIPLKWQHVIIWGGLHGGLSMVLALSLEQSIPNRDLLLSSVFGVVFISLVLQGTTMAKLLNFLNLSKTKTDPEIEYEKATADLIRTNASEDELEELWKKKLISKKIYKKFKSRIKRLKKKSEKNFDRIYDKFPELEKTQKKEVEKSLLISQKSSLIDAHKSGIISEKTKNRIVTEIDRKIVELR
ncbi:Na+/H+ antiporter [Candidatus Woesearchaeota archaeon]|nr:Na+/H+ antiporter [Candidatus Woesearchaeota archaeon]